MLCLWNIHQEIEESRNESAVALSLSLWDSVPVYRVYARLYTIVYILP